MMDGLERSALDVTYLGVELRAAVMVVVVVVYVCVCGRELSVC